MLERKVLSFPVFMSPCTETSIYTAKAGKHYTGGSFIGNGPGMTETTLPLFRLR